MDDAGYIAEDRQKDVYPEVLANSHLQEHSGAEARPQPRDAISPQKNLLNPTPLKTTGRGIAS